MADEFINLTPENVADEHIFCIIRAKKSHPGIEAKCAWLAERLKEGHVFRKLDAKECVFIEYAPLEKAWVPIEGDNYYCIYCLWVQGAPKGHGYGKQLMEYCIADAKANGKSGICMLGANKQKAWLSDQEFAKRYGFETVDTAGEYELLALSFDGTAPHFTAGTKTQKVDYNGLLVYYDDQCPYIAARVEKLKEYCQAKAIDARFIHVQTLDQAKALSCVFNNWAVYYGGRFVTVNQIDGAALEKITKQKEKR